VNGDRTRVFAVGDSVREDPSRDDYRADNQSIRRANRIFDEVFFERNFRIEVEETQMKEVVQAEIRKREGCYSSA
jgi:hypothetical protein